MTGASDTDANWNRQFGYDTWGNAWVTGNNQTATANYDSAGNLLAVNGFTLAYDAENRQVSVTEQPSRGGAQELYLYDGAGQRVEKVGMAGNTIYVYDAFGQLSAEYNTFSTSFACSTCYLTTDQLGSVRMVTDQTGTAVTRHDYLPFGEEIPSTSANTDVEQRFTGQIRDTGTGMDYFNARYYTGPLMRFNSPDPGNAGADPTDPQTWNGYSYVRNNPLVLTDPSGEILDGTAVGGEVGGVFGAVVGTVVDLFAALFGIFDAGGGGHATLAPPTDVWWAAHDSKSQGGCPVKFN